MQTYQGVLNDIALRVDSQTKSKRANVGGRPRKNKAVAHLSITIDADMLADLDAIVARGVITRNAMIKMLIMTHINKYKE
jgi:hypothetical protein